MVQGQQSPPECGEDEADCCGLQESAHPAYPTIDGAAVERVSSTKFLGVHISEDLSWSHNTASLAKKAQQRLYFLPKLRRAGAPPPIMHTFYRGTIESILSSCITVWYGAALTRQFLPAGCQETQLPPCSTITPPPLCPLTPPHTHTHTHSLTHSHTLNSGLHISLSTVYLHYSALPHLFKYLTYLNTCLHF